MSFCKLQSTVISGEATADLAEIIGHLGPIDDEISGPNWSHPQACRDRVEGEGNETLKILSGQGFVAHDRGRCPVSYGLGITEKKAYSINGTLIGDFAILFNLWQTATEIRLILEDGKAIDGVLINVDQNGAAFKSVKSGGTLIDG